VTHHDTELVDGPSVCLNSNNFALVDVCILLSTILVLACKQHIS